MIIHDVCTGWRATEVAGQPWLGEEPESEELDYRDLAGRGRGDSRGPGPVRVGTCGSGYLACLGSGRQARVSPVVAPYGHHAGSDFVAQFQGEHRQQHDGDSSGEEG